MAHHHDTIIMTVTINSHKCEIVQRVFVPNTIKSEQTCFIPLSIIFAISFFYYFGDNQLNGFNIFIYTKYSSE